MNAPRAKSRRWPLTTNQAEAMRADRLRAKRTVDTGQWSVSTLVAMTCVR
jgi:hypothetical protein